MTQFRRITIEPEVLAGKPCIRGMRVTVGMIVQSLAADRIIEQLLADFPYFGEGDIHEVLAFAAHLAQGHYIGSPADAPPHRHEPDAAVGGLFCVAGARRNTLAMDRSRGGQR